MYCQTYNTVLVLLTLPESANIDKHMDNGYTGNKVYKEAPSDREPTRVRNFREGHYLFKYT